MKTKLVSSLLLGTSLFDAHAGPLDLCEIAEQFNVPVRVLLESAVDDSEALNDLLEIDDAPLETPRPASQHDSDEDLSEPIDEASEDRKRSIRIPVAGLAVEPRYGHYRGVERAAQRAKERERCECRHAKHSS